MGYIRLSLAALGSGLALLALAPPTAAQQDVKPITPPAPTAVVAPAINYRERPRVPFDAQRLKGAPKIDGVLGASEWQPLYTIGEGADATATYLTWDEGNLYIAARLAKPGWLVIDLDAAGDGWLRGADNLEIVVAPRDATGVAPITTRLLDAAANKDAPVWNDTVVDPKVLNAVIADDKGAQVVEIAIPKGIAGLQPRADGTIGFRADILPAAASAPTPTAPYEPHLLLDLVMVETKTVAAPGMSPKLTLEDARLVPGQTLRANLDVANQIETERRFRSISWQGEGPAANILKQVREVTVPSVKGLKSVRMKYVSALPENTVPGFYQLSSSAILDDGSTVSATTIFQVVEPITVQFAVEPQSVTLVGPTKLRAVVTIDCAAPGYSKGSVSIEPPAGWEINGKPKLLFSSHKQDTADKLAFNLTAPSTTKAGEYSIGATITYGDRTWKVQRPVTVARTAGQ